MTRDDKVEATLGICGVLGFTFLICFVVWSFIATSKHPAIIKERNWERTVTIEEFRTVHYEDVTCFWGPPTDARNVEKRTEVDTWCSTDAEGNIKYESDETTYYTYDHDEWTRLDSVKLSERNTEPKWPNPTLAVGPLGKQNKIGRRYEHFYLKVEFATEPVTYETYEVDRDTWNRFSEDELVDVITSKVGIYQGIAKIDAEDPDETTD